MAANYCLIIFTSYFSITIHVIAVAKFFGRFKHVVILSGLNSGYSVVHVISSVGHVLLL